MKVFNCTHCGKESRKVTGHYNRSISLGSKLYCSQNCQRLGNRIVFDQFLGKKYRRLTVISFKRKSPLVYVNCLCDCGSKKTALWSNVKSGTTVSCGCGNIRSLSHGMSNSPTYRSWSAMKARCNQGTASGKSKTSYAKIKLCKRWNTFENFLADMGPRPKRHSIDRINNKKGYFKLNCRWATNAQQARNRSTNRWIEIDGVKKIMSDWARVGGIPPSLLSRRLKNGLSPKDAVFVTTIINKTKETT